MRHILPSALTLSLAWTMAAHAGDADVVARMGDTTLTLAEVRQIAAQNPAEAQNAPQGIERLVRTELVRKAVAKEARKQGFDKKPEVSAQMERAVEQALVAAYMNSIARPPADYPSEDVLKQAYEANKAAFTTPVQYRVSQIYVAGKDAKASQQADELYRQATRKNADFAEIARKSSQHQASAAQGGDMGWLPENDLLPAIRSALNGLKPGDTARPVAGAEGFHIVKLAERKEPQILPLDKVKPALVQNLRLRRAQEIEAAYLEDLLAKTPVAVNGIALGEAVKAK
ncbi:MAG: peptidylprolyl isomerase [Hydrogenophilaceae bacterium]|nr:peptidylprolyl isomerase [Hydrogenophilaceae bacterium]